jgi:hypothetical protein
MELEKIKDKLTSNEYIYFSQLQTYLDLTLFFIGSIARSDYFQNNSDIDIEVFSDNIASSKFKIDNLFSYYNVQINKFIVFKIKDMSVSGCKYSVYDKQYNIHFDLTLYKKKCQNMILYYRNMEINIPFFFKFILIILKCLRYYLNIIDSYQYSRIKKKLWYFYNSNKTPSITLILNDYKKYYEDTEQKKYLIDI